jgi:hypothetical protein
MSLGRFGVNEIVVATFADTAEDRLQSYQLLAEIFNLKQRTALKNTLPADRN